MATVEMDPVSPTRTTLEQSENQPEPGTESSSIPSALSSPSASDLVEATEAGSSTLTVRPISAPNFHFLEAILLKTPYLKIAPIATTPAIPELSTMAFPQ